MTLSSMCPAASTSALVQAAKFTIMPQLQATSSWYWFLDQHQHHHHHDYADHPSTPDCYQQPITGSHPASRQLAEFAKSREIFTASSFSCPKWFTQGIHDNPIWSAMAAMVMAANPPLRHATNWTQTEAPFDEPSSTSCHDSPPAMPGWNSSSLSLRTTITHLSNSKWCYSNYSIQYTVYYSNYGINTATWLASAKSFDSAIFSQLMPTLYCGAWLILKYQKTKLFILHVISLPKNCCWELWPITSPVTCTAIQCYHPTLRKQTHTHTHAYWTSTTVDTSHSKKWCEVATITGWTQALEH